MCSRVLMHLNSNRCLWESIYRFKNLSLHLLNSHIFICVFSIYKKLFVISQPDMSKNLYIISGCNGAGKTTASYTVLPEILNCKEFVNADEIARGLSPFNPESVAIEAGRLMLQRIEFLLEKDTSFSIETILLN